MGEQSRIKFNPVTQEIEIEGSEQFIKTYFDKIQAMLSGTKETVAKAPIKKKPAKAIKEMPAEEKVVKEKPAKKARKAKKAAKVATREKLVKESKRGSKSNAVLSLIQESPDGITTTELEEKTGLKDRQIWAIISNGKRAGKIKQAKRGVYVGA